MSEPVAKDRPTVDLDDFERRLRQQDHHEDPLAELARLVGEHPDPYNDVFAQESARFEAPASQGHRSNSYHPEHERADSYRAAGQDQGYDAGGVSPRLSGDFASIEAGLRGALSAHPEAGDYNHEHDFYARQDAYAQHDQYAQHEADYPQDDDESQWSQAPREAVSSPAARSRKPVYAMVAAIAVGVIGVGVAFAYKGSSSGPVEIKTIAAASGPTKIQPPADASGNGNTDPGNPDSAILGKAGQTAPTRVVNGEEQPVDINQAVQENASRDADAGGGQGDAANVPVPSSPNQSSTTNMPTVVPLPGTPAPGDQLPSFGLSGLPAPKKVKVVSVRPDGTILSGDQPSAAPPPAGDQDGVPANTSSSKTATPKSTSRVATTPKTPAVSDEGDAPATKPLHKPKPKRVAAVTPPADDSAPADTADVTKAAGGFAVQLAAPTSESDARAATSRLAKKFASALDGRHIGVRKAQSNGKSVFRVRISSLTKEDAVSLCEKLKADGGSCFVAKN
jgi:hypothetical protein